MAANSKGALVSLKKRSRGTRFLGPRRSTAATAASRPASPRAGRDRPQ